MLVLHRVLTSLNVARNSMGVEGAKLLGGALARYAVVCCCGLQSAVLIS